MEPTQLDAGALKALGHPLRIELFRALQEQPATSAHLARALGENTGTVSWHLRQLARFGLIVDDTGHADGRERWWRAVPGRLSLDIREGGINEDPAALEAARWYVHDTWGRAFERLSGWIDSAHRWSGRWVGASVLSEQVMELTAEELAELQAEVTRVVEQVAEAAERRPRERATRRVQVSFQAFPLGEPDGD